MDKQRLFIGIGLPDRLVHAITALQTDLKPFLLKGRLTRPGNLHLTLVFLGMVPNEDVGKVTEVLNQLETGTFDLDIAGRGHFDKSDGRIEWLGIGDSPELDRRVKNLKMALRQAGFTFEDQPFVPHLTLGRGIRLKTGYQTAPFEPFTINVARISLFRSEQIDGVLTYTEIAFRDLND